MTPGPLTYTQLDQLWKLVDELTVQDLENLLGLVVFLLSPRQPGHVLGRLVYELTDF